MKCAKSDCEEEALEDSNYCLLHKPKYKLVMESIEYGSDEDEDTED